MKIPLLAHNSFRVLSLKQSNPKLTVFEIAANAIIPVQELHSHLHTLQLLPIRQVKRNENAAK